MPLDVPPRRNVAGRGFGRRNVVEDELSRANHSRCAEEASVLWLQARDLANMLNDRVG